MCSCCLVISKWNHKYFKSYLKLKYIIKHVIPNCNLCFYYELGTYVKKKRTILKQNAHHFIFFSIFLECEKLDWDLRPNPSPLYRMHIQTIIHSDALLLERILSKIENTQNLSWNIWVHRFSENTRLTTVYIWWLIVWSFPKKVLVERIQVAHVLVALTLWFTLKTHVYCNVSWNIDSGLCQFRVYNNACR